MQQARACHAAPLTAQLRRRAGQVADFGCAHLAPAPGVVARQLRRGTLAYQPPELLDGGIGTPAADCYAFGALLWEMLTAQARPGFHTCGSRSPLCSIILQQATCVYLAPAVLDACAPA
jgi:serine/threonine protein kinase